MAEPPVSSKIEHLDIVIDATIRAGEKIVQIYESDFEVEKKNDKLIINIIIRNEIEKMELHILSIIIE